MPVGPIGLTYLPHVLPVDEHDQLLKLLTDNANKGSDNGWKTAGQRANRIVRHFGYNYPYTAKLELTLADAIPEWLWPVIQLLRQQPGLEDFKPDQAIINRYLTNEGIGKHVDHTKLFGDTVVSVTIGAGATLRFCHTESGVRFDQNVKPCSAYVMTGESRYEWTHEMLKSKAQTQTRFSITFREVHLEYLKKGCIPHSILPIYDTDRTEPKCPIVKLHPKLRMKPLTGSTTGSA